MAGRVYKGRNCDKCTSFLSGTANVADSALRQVHVTVEKQRAREQSGWWGEEGNEEKCKMWRERERG